MGSLHVRQLLDDKYLAMIVKRFIASLYHDKLPVAEVARLYLDPRVYQIYAKSTTEQAAFQTYERLKAGIFTFLETRGQVMPNGKRNESLTLQHALTLNQPLAIDGLPKESPVWLRF